MRHIPLEPYCSTTRSMNNTVAWRQSCLMDEDRKVEEGERVPTSLLEEEDGWGFDEDTEERERILD